MTTNEPKPCPLSNGGSELSCERYQTQRDCEPCTNPQPEFLTVDDLAARWSLSVSMIRKLIRSGELRATHFGSAVRISTAEADRFIRERSQGGDNVLG